MKDCQHPKGWKCAGYGNKGRDGLTCICECPTCHTPATISVKPEVEKCPKVGTMHLGCGICDKHKFPEFATPVHTTWEEPKTWHSVLVEVDGVSAQIKRDGEKWYLIVDSPRVTHKADITSIFQSVQDRAKEEGRQEADWMGENLLDARKSGFKEGRTAAIEEV